MASFLDATVVFSGDVFNAAKAAAETERVVGRALTQSSLFLQGQMVQNTPAGVTGALGGGWAWEYDKAESEARVYNSVEYALPTELGRRPAPIPIKPLALWVRRKLGISDEKKAVGVAFAISKKAAKVGVPTNPAVNDNRFFASDTFEANIPVINQNFLFPIGGEIVKALEI